jgi:hypothetical protein
LLAVGFFTMAAIVLDVAGLRQGRRSDRTAADLAASAAVTGLDVSDSSSYARACSAAWGYVLANRNDVSPGGTAAAPDCAGVFPSSQACLSGMAARTAVGTWGPLTVSITSPVPDDSPLMLAEAQGGDIAQPVNPATDGAACARVGVRIERTRTFLFGGIAGVAGGSTDVHSVARALTTTSTTEVPGVVALEPSGCDGVSTDGAGGTLQVEGAGLPGVVVVDSDGSSCGGLGGFTITPRGTGRLVATPNGPAAGVISSFALGGSNFARAYDPAAVAGGRLSPQPTPSFARTGRGIIDARYNCTTGGCAAGADHVDQLRASFGGPGAPAGLTPYAGPCSVAGGFGSAGAVVGSTFVDCPVFDVFGPVTFSGAAVVFAGDVVIHGGGCLAVNSAFCGASGTAAQDGVVYVRGSLSKPLDGVLLLNQAFVYAAGGIDLPPSSSGGFGSVVWWKAPLAGSFEDLLGWTDAASTVDLGGQDVTMLEGTIFAPNATVVLEAAPDCNGNGNGGGNGNGNNCNCNGNSCSGGPPPFDVPLQVVAKRVSLHGPDDVTLAPNATRATGRITRQVRLLR